MKALGCGSETRIRIRFLIGPCLLSTIEVYIEVDDIQEEDDKEDNDGLVQFDDDMVEKNVDRMGEN